ncbi:hypothetical protein ACLBXM_19870 [Xanthobacteraceae bacterium A53D]
MRTYFGERERCVREFVMVDISQLKRTLRLASAALATLVEEIEGPTTGGSAPQARRTPASGERGHG